MISKNDKIYRLNDDTIDSLNRFLKADNIVAYAAALFLNIFWLIGKIIKKLLKKDKIEIVKEEKNEVPISKNFTLKGLSKVLETYKKGGKYVLYIDLFKETNDISGALDYSINKKNEFVNDGLNIIDFQYYRQSNKWFVVLDKENIIALEAFNDIGLLFDNFDIKEIFINNLLYCTNPNEVIGDILFLKTKYHFIIEYAFHDYLSICPSYFLINKQGMPCEIVDNENCNECLLNNPYRSLIVNDIKKWRSTFENLFKECENILVFSNFSKVIINNVFSGLENKIRVVPHKSLLNDNYTKYIRPKKTDVLTIAFVGNFHHVKGADFYIELIDRLINNGYNVNPIVIGYKQENEYNG